MEKKLTWLLLCVLVGAGVAWFLIPRASPRSVTMARMSALRHAILQYAREQSRLPPTLTTLPEAKGQGADLLDGWQRPIACHVDPDDTVTLTSLGADGQPGGVKENQDLIGRFETRDAQGRWLENLGPWLQYPLDSPVERFEELRARAVAMGATPEGQAYEPLFSSAAGRAVQEGMTACAQGIYPPFSISLVFELTANGHPRRIVPAPNEPISACLAERLAGLALPPPPQDGWLVHVAIDVHLPPK